MFNASTAVQYVVIPIWMEAFSTECAWATLYLLDISHGPQTASCFLTCYVLQFTDPFDSYSHPSVWISEVSLPKESLTCQVSMFYCVIRKMIFSNIGTEAAVIQTSRVLFCFGFMPVRRLSHNACFVFMWLDRCWQVSLSPLCSRLTLAWAVCLLLLIHEDNTVPSMCMAGF